MSIRLSKTGRYLVFVARATRRLLLLGAFLVTWLGVPAGQAQAQAGDANLHHEQLEQLVAPIALYPDSLLAQVFMAATYPIEIVQAERWAKANSKLKGKALEDALQSQPWDPSVKSIVAVAQVLQMMSDQLDWTEMLGNAFLAQQEDLLNAAQALRAKADAEGTLKTTSQQKVSKQPVTSTSGGGATTAIVIESADPQVIYVPTYNPGVVYGAWPYPSYPPYYWYPPGYVASNLVSFGLGVAVGAAIWGNCNWGRNQVNINVNNFNAFNRTNITNANWQHNAAHRKGVPYASSNIAQRLGQTGGSTAARDAFRGRAEAGQFGLGNPAGQNRIGNAQDRIGNQTPGTRQPGARQSVGTGGAPNLGSNLKNNTGAVKSAAADRIQNRAAGGAANAANRGQVRALDGIGRGQGVRQESARGAASRNAMASALPAGGGARPSGGAVGGGARAGGGGRGGGERLGGGRRR
jgi:Protein of unknown function (DUF3300)